METCIAQAANEKVGLLGEEEFVVDSKDFLVNYKRSHRISTIIYGILAVLSLAILPLIGFFVGRRFALPATENISIWNPSLANIRTLETRFNGSLYGSNKFRGPPSSEIDEQWSRFTTHPRVKGQPVILSVSSEDVARSGNKFSPATLVELPASEGGGFMGGIEMFHQVHCLDMLRKATYLDYYAQREPMWTTMPKKQLRMHLDHCVDLLRQALMCQGDTTLILYHWTEELHPPVPDFSTTHQCRDPEEILAWAMERDKHRDHEVVRTGNWQNLAPGFLNGE